MRLLYVWDAEYPWDVRTEKICLALAQRGHHVVITARNLKGRPRTESRPEGTVERLPAWAAVAGAWMTFPAPVNPIWLYHLRRVIRKHRIDLVVARDIPLAPAAVLAAGNRPVILDMAENYPAMIQDVWTDRRQRPLDVVVRNPRVVALVERLVVRRVNHILTVVEESSDRLARLGVPRERMSVVSNTPPRARAGSPRADSGGGPLRLIYLGLMEQHRGIGCVLDAMAILLEAGVPFQLDLVGDGRDFEDLQRHATGLALTGAVTFHGRLAHDQAIALVSRADVGLVPHEARESWNTTIPNKLFDYMAAGLTVITSDAAPAARVVRETGAGLVFPSGDPKELAAAVRQCIDPGARDRWGRAGQEAIRTRYNWEADTDVLLDVVRQVGARSGPSSEEPTQ